MDNFPSEHTLGRLKLKAFNPIVGAEICEPKRMLMVLLGFSEKRLFSVVL
jgi:hypothetical protein